MQHVLTREKGTKLVVGGGLFLPLKRISPFGEKDYLLCKACSSSDAALGQCVSKNMELLVDFKPLLHFRSAASNKSGVLATSCVPSMRLLW